MGRTPCGNTGTVALERAFHCQSCGWCLQQNTGAEECSACSSPLRVWQLPGGKTRGILVSNCCQPSPPKVWLKCEAAQPACVSCTDCKSWCFKLRCLLRWSTGICFPIVLTIGVWKSMGILALIRVAMNFSFYFLLLIHLQLDPAGASTQAPELWWV